MTLTFSFTARLTAIAIISFLVFFAASLIMVYEIGKKHGIRSALVDNEKIKINKEKKSNSNQVRKDKK